MYGIFIWKRNTDNQPLNENQLDQLLSSKPYQSTIENVEKEKVKEAIRTDFILSPDIIVII